MQHATMFLRNLNFLSVVLLRLLRHTIEAAFSNVFEKFNFLSVSLSQWLRHSTEAVWQNVFEKFLQSSAVATVATWHRGSLPKCL
jgi:hypothetical protein